MSVTGAIATTKVGRNDPCPCGSGRKFKHCCGGKEGARSPAGTAQGSRPSPALRERQQALHLAARKLWDAGKWADTIPLFREIVRLDPSNPQAHHDLGLAFRCCGRLAEATVSLQRAAELRPSFDSALSYLVDVLEMQGREPEALAACRRLSRRADGDLERRHYSAKALAMEGKLEEAEKELRRVLVVAPQRAATRILLGRLLSDRGMFDEAAHHLALAIEAVPAVFQQLTAVKPLTESDRPLVDRMRVLAERPGLDVTTRVCVHFGLGKALDDLGDYAEAMRHYQAANRLKAMSMRLDRAKLVAQYDSIIACFTPESLARALQSRARPGCLGDDMPLFIAGMPRSGTTLIEQILSSHPAVGAGGELPFWNDRLTGPYASRIRSLEAHALSKAAEDYRALLREIGPEALRVTDKSSRNFELLGLFRLALPDGRIIHCRRRAVDTCLSIFFTNFVSRQDYAWDRGDVAFYYRQYERLMDHWRRALPADRFTEVEYETLVVDREVETHRLVAFCGLEWDDACLAPEQNTRVVKTASLWQARQPVYKTSVERWRRYEPWLGELSELLRPAEAAAS